MYGADVCVVQFFQLFHHSSVVAYSGKFPSETCLHFCGGKIGEGNYHKLRNVRAVCNKRQNALNHYRRFASTCRSGNKQPPSAEINYLLLFFGKFFHTTIISNPSAFFNTTAQKKVGRHTILCAVRPYYVVVINNQTPLLRLALPSRDTSFTPLQSMLRARCSSSFVIRIRLCSRIRLRPSVPSRRQTQPLR